MPTALPQFEYAMKEGGFDSTALGELSAKEALTYLHSLLRLVESQGFSINWHSLSLYYPESAAAILERLLDSDYQWYVWNGLATKEHPSCMAGGVRLFRNPDFFGYRCSCSLVSSTAVITARHCVEGSEKMAWVNPMPEVDGYREWRSAEIAWTGGDRVQPRAGHYGRGPDLAALEVRSGDLPEPGLYPRLASEDLFGQAREALIVGYGPEGRSASSAGTRREGIVYPIWRSVIRRPSGGVVQFDPVTEFVCGSGLSSQDALPGDSGAPIYLKDEKSQEWRVAGVLSRGAGLNTSLGAGAIYTKLNPFLPEIENEVGPLRIRLDAGSP